jgi:HTH-type transcriptional regulator/antitoxin HigA
MITISKSEYNKSLAKFKELLLLVDDNTPIDDPNLKELDIVFDNIKNYETEHYPIQYPPIKFSEYRKKIKELNEQIKKEPIQFLEGFTAEKIRKLNNRI